MDSSHRVYTNSTLGVTVPTERRIREGHSSTFPRTAGDILAHYEKSDVNLQMKEEYDYSQTDTAKEHTLEFERTIHDEKHPGFLTKSAPVTVGFRTQLIAAIQRQYHILMGDKSVIIIKQVSNIIQAFSCGSLFYSALNTSTGTFLKSGAIFVALVFNSLLAQSEVTDSFFGRPVLAKHRSFAYHHPAAWCLAQIITDIPILLFQISAFSLVVYFLVGLNSYADGFFTFWFVLFSSTACMTALFRAIGAAFKTFDDASKVSGVVVMALLMYNGYMIPKTEMPPWFVW